MMQEPGMLQAQACHPRACCQTRTRAPLPRKDAPGDWCSRRGLDASRVVGRAVSSGCRELPGGPSEPRCVSSPTHYSPPPRAQPGQHGRVALRLGNSTQDFFSEPASSQEGFPEACAEKGDRPLLAPSQDCLVKSLGGYRGGVRS